MNTSVGPSLEKVPDVAPPENGGRDPATKIHGAPAEAPSGGGVEPRYFWAISALLGVIALLKAARVPSLWAASHLTINYSHGFVRRGLVGEILWLLGGGRFFKYNTLAFLAALMSVAAGTLLVVTLRRMFRADARDAALQGAVCALLASPGLVFFVHMVGYFDTFGLVMSFGFVLGLTRMKRIYLPFFVAASIGVLMALVHEALVVMFFPPLSVAMICHVIVRSRDVNAAVQRRRLRLMSVAAVAATSTAFTAAIIVGVVGTRSPELVEALRASVARYANFPLRKDAFEVLLRPVKDAIFHYVPAILENPDNVSYLVRSLVAQLPTHGFLLYYGVRVIGRLGLGRGPRTILTAAFVFAALAPLMLNFVGVDSARWGATATLSAFGSIVAIRLLFMNGCADPTRHRIPSPSLPSLAAAVAILGLCTNYSYFLFDGYHIQWFPFDERIKSILDLFRPGVRFIPGA